MECTWKDCQNEGQKTFIEAGEVGGPCVLCIEHEQALYNSYGGGLDWIIKASFLATFKNKA